jgi:DNA-binding XRE family transcriptional regulator
MKKLKTARQILDKKYGEIGTKSREDFTEEAYAFYLSEILKSRRKELKMTQEDVAQKVGKKRPYISRVENGEDVRISNFVQIARVLGLNLELKPS